MKIIKLQRNNLQQIKIISALFIISFILFLLLSTLNSSPTSAQTSCSDLGSSFGSANYSLTDVLSGNHRLWLRVKSTDGTASLRFNLSGGGTSCNQTVNTANATSWRWVQSSVLFTTTGGTVSVQLAGTKAGVGVDCFVLTSDTSFNPTTIADCAGPQTDSSPPVLNFTSPAQYATISGTATVTVTATDVESPVSQVAFSISGSDSLNAIDTTAPYEYSINTTLLVNGPVTITAVATNSSGLTTSSSLIITVSNSPPDTTPPIISLTAPTNNVTVSGTITVSADASDNVGVSRVSYFLDGSSTAFSNDSSAPYSSSWASSTVANGTHTIRATAIDAAGNVTTSSPITINVQNVVPDTTKPTTQITAPANNATVYGTITINASASDNVGVTKVDLLIDGFKAATDLTSPYGFQLDTTILSEGNHIVTTRAYDAANNIQISTPVTINVDNIPPAPVLCQDTTANNIGQPLPCTYNTPPTNPPPAKPGDVTGDGKVDRTDLRQLIINYGRNVTTNTSGDVNGDGKVDRADLRILIINYGK